MFGPAGDRLPFGPPRQPYSGRPARLSLRGGEPWPVLGVPICSRDRAAPSGPLNATGSSRSPAPAMRSRKSCCRISGRVNRAVGCYSRNRASCSLFLRPLLFITGDGTGLVSTTKRCRDYGPSHHLWLVGRDSDAGDLCPGETQCVVRSGLRRGLCPRLGLWVFARCMAIWHHRSHLGLRGFSPLLVYRKVTHDGGVGVGVGVACGSKELPRLV
jgi:hypothetical protein